MKKNYKLLKHYFILAAVIFTFIAKPTAAQPPQIQWAKCFGGSSNDRAKDIHRTSDSGYIVCGFTSSIDGQVTNNHGGVDGWIVKLDVDGNLQWEKTYGGTGDDALNAIRQLNDGGYIAVGYADSANGDIDSSHGDKDFWVVRTNSSGTIIWESTFGGSFRDVANDIATTSDTGFVVVGYTFSDDGQVDNYKGAGDGWIVYVDTLGHLIREKDKGGHSYDEFKSVITAGNGGFIVVGLSNSNNGTLAGLNHGGSDAWVARLSKFGTDQWNALFGDSLDDGAFDVHEDEFNHFVVSGHRDFLGQTDSWLFTVDSLGGFISESTHGGTGQELDGASIQKTPSNYIVSGSSNSVPSGDKDCIYGGYDFWMYNTLLGGAITWQKCMGGTADDIASRAIASPDGSIGLCGWTNSTDLDVIENHGDYDFWVLRLLDGCDVTAGFTYTQSDLTVSFTNISFDAITFSWTFGDGNTSTEINPTHVYDQPGVYTVCLISSSLCAVDTSCTEITVGCVPVTAGFSFVANGLNVQFTDNSGTATSWQWTFGDGGSSNAANPNYTYLTFGTYNVCLIASNDCSVDTFCTEVTVQCADVIVGFTYVANGFDVQFTDASIGATSWQWTFGDGGSSFVQSPAHTYGNSGTYTVCLIASNECSIDTFCTDVIICGTVTAGFTFSASQLNVQFTDLSANATSWEWTFGDGNGSNVQSPNYSYSGPGTFTVCLVASNECSTDTFCTEVTVECSLVSDGFDFATNGLFVSFTDLSSGATSWNWTFGDGDTSDVQNPTHTYATAGTYTVCLIVSNVCFSDTFCTEITVECAPVSAGFTFSSSGLTAQFADLSVGATSWDWNFGDGNTSNSQNPSHTYSASGTYTVCLMASNECSIDTFCTEITVQCIEANAGFTTSASGLNVTFTDLSANATSWQWTFGDGNTSNLQSPTNQYPLPGTYEVCLIVSNDCSTDSICISITVDFGVGTGAVDAQFSSLNIHPNPFSDVTTISFTVTDNSLVTITLTDVQGRLLRTVLNENLSHGDHSIMISKESLSAGIYLLQLKQGSESVVKRLVIE